MEENLIDRLRRQIEQNWTAAGVWPDFMEAMHRALSVFNRPQADCQTGPARLALLPGLCCQAAGGDPLWADDLALAWLLLYIAAHLMDSVEDQDEPDAWWAGLGPGAAINASTGLFFSAALALQRLFERPETRAKAEATSADFYRSFLTMCSGQHLDLVHPEPGLEQYWQIVAAKSGTFFALACRCGARLAAANPTCLEAFSRFGQHIGCLIQIRDDLGDVTPAHAVGSFSWKPEIRRSLPVVYALQVFPQPLGARLRQSLQAAPHSFQAAEEALDLIEQSGAALFISLEVDRHRRLALEALAQAMPQPAAAEMLIALIHQLAPGNQEEENR